MARFVSKDGMPCPYCTRTMVKSDGNIKLAPTSDHVIPKSRLKQKRGRTIIVCSECNFMKNALTLSEWVQVLHLKNIELTRAIANNRERMRNVQYLIQIGIEE